MNSFEKEIIELMKFNGKQSISLPECDMFLHNLHSLKLMMTGQADRLFCNSFLSEMIQLLINSSIRSNYNRLSWSSSEYQRYLNYDETLNESYHNIYRSITKGIGENWIFEHNEPLSDGEMKLIKSILDNYRTVNGACHLSY